MTLQLTSPAFIAHGTIPPRYTGDGEDISPPLVWSGVPLAAKSLALIVDDPDAPGGVWVHWVLYNLPPDCAGLAEGITARTLPPGAREGLNSWKRLGYGGPCPPAGRHHYFHKLYALDVVLPDLHSPAKAAVEAAMEGHTLARAELVGTYQRRK